MANDPQSENFDFSQFEEDEKAEWWQPTKRDDYDLTNKLYRVGCRPAKRKYLICKREYQTEFEECSVNLLNI